jgi:hypothetical protein
MKEWLSLDPEASLPWAPLAREALEFVRGARWTRHTQLILGFCLLV